MSQKKSILCAVLNQGEIATNLTNSLRVMGNNPDYDVDIELPDDAPISNNRNKIVQRFLAKDYDYLLMIDSDIVPPPSVVNLADYQKDIMGTLCFIWQQGAVLPTVWNRHRDGMYNPIDIRSKEGVVEADAIGSGCIMLSRKVLEEVKAPFLNEYDADGIKLFGLDIAFCKKAKKQGFKVFANLDYACDHWKKIDLKMLYAIIYGQMDKIKEMGREILFRGENVIKENGNRYLVMDGHKFLLPKDKEVGINSVMEAYCNLKDVWEPNTTQLVKERIKEGMTVLDVGASIGYFTQLLARQVGPTGRVLSFEPTPNQVPYLTENVEANGYTDRVKIFPVAAWNNNKGIKMPPGTKKYDCPSITIDEALENEGIDKVDFMKIDVDGSEPQVLEGLKKTFEKNPNLQIMFEYYPRCIKELGGDPKSVKKTIEKYFNIEIIPSDIDPVDGSNWWCTRK
jgi:tRNA A58 N-methylase Trm61